MRAWVMSDLHVDAAPFVLPETPPDVDVIVIAGDVADGHERSARWLREHVVPQGLPVIFIAGNHDFYGTDLAEEYAGIYAEAGVELLHPGQPTIEISGVRFIGSTLWTDYAIAGDVDAARSWARQSMPDLMSIDLGLRRIHTRNLLDMHRQQRMLIERELTMPFDGLTIVVTHHAPHPNSLRSACISKDDASWASDLTAVIERYRPTVWIHGHTHESHDYHVGATRIICNPRGYDIPAKFAGRMGNKAFNPELVIDLNPGPRIASVPGVMSGDPVIVGTRILAAQIVRYIEAGMTECEIHDEYPSLPLGGVQAVKEWMKGNRK